MRRSPGRILLRHPADEVDQLERDRRTTRVMGFRLPLPVVLPALAVSMNDGVGLDENERVAPFFPESAEENPEHAIGVVDLGALHAALQHRELLAQCEVFQGELVAVKHQRADQDEDV